MRKLTTAALLLGGAILASPSAYAQSTFVPNDLYFGFQNAAGGGSADYIINLGAASGIVGQSSVVNLSPYFSVGDFFAVLGSSPNTLMGGVVGGLNGTPADLYVTQLRTGNIGNPAVAGSTLNTVLKQSIDNTAVTVLSQLDAPSAGTGILDASKTWETYVEPTANNTSFYGNIGINPDSAVSTTSVLYEDLYQTIDSGDARGSQGNGFNYLGYFTLDLTGSSPSLTFTGAGVAPVPEPTTFGLCTAAGLLLLTFRRRLTGRSA